MNTYLILNADDFGYDSETNETIEELIRAERISSVSLLACGPAAADAAKRANRLDFAVGAHLCLVSDGADHPWKSLSGTKSIGESLPHDFLALTFGAKRQDVRKEVAAQYDFLIAKGCRLDHADGHSGSFYGVNGRRFYRDAFDFCAEKGLPFRLPKTPGFFARELGGHLPFPMRLFHGHLVHLALRRNVMLPDDVISDPRKAKDIGSREALYSYYMNAVRNCGPGVTEIFLHPRKAHAAPGSPWQKRHWEYELLSSGELLRAAKEAGVRVVTPFEAYKLTSPTEGSLP